MTVWFVNRQLALCGRDEQREQPVLGEGEGSLTASSQLPGTLGGEIWTGLNLPLSVTILSVYSLSPCLPPPPLSSPAACPSPSIQATEFVLS